MTSFNATLCFVVVGALATGVAVPWVWDTYRDHVRRKAAAREEAARATQLDRWWRHHSVSTMPQSRMFDSSFEEAGHSVSLPSQHP